jgi:hypothetical protein
MTIFKLCMAALIALVVGAWAEQAKVDGRPVDSATSMRNQHASR